MKLIVVDDNENFRNNLKLFLEMKLEHQVIGEASSGEEFLELNMIHECDIVLMDIMMKQLNGMATTKKILTQQSHIKIIAVTMHIEAIFQLQLIQAGFKGCVFKTDVFENIENAIQAVQKGKIFFPDNIQLKNTP